MTRFEPAPAAVTEILAAVVSEHRPELAEVRITAVMARGEVPAAEARPTTAAQRAAGLADVLVVLDAASWERDTPEVRAAKLDHALAAVRPATRRGTDGAGRPRLGRRPPDLDGIGYLEVWRRHGGDSIESARAAELRRAAGQLLLFGDVPE